MLYSTGRLPVAMMLMLPSASPQSEASVTPMLVTVGASWLPTEAITPGLVQPGVALRTTTL